ncbi:MAG: hypothetical protein ACLFPV_14820 [Spirochaetaceae bacterium]
MDGFTGLLFFARRYLGILLSALPWLVLGIILEAAVLPRRRGRLSSKLSRDGVGLALFSGGAQALLLPDSLYEKAPSGGPSAWYRIILSRSLHPLLLISVFVVFRRQIVLPFYYLFFVIAGGLIVGLVVRLLVSAGMRDRDAGSAAPPPKEEEFTGRLVQRSYDHSVDLLFGAFLAAALHSLLGTTGLESMVFPPVILAFATGALASPPPATAGAVALSLFPLGQPSMTLAYLLGTGWGSLRVTGSLRRRLGWGLAIDVSLLIALLSILLSSLVTWTTLELLS